MTQCKVLCDTTAYSACGDPSLNLALREGDIIEGEQTYGYLIFAACGDQKYYVLTKDVTPVWPEQRGTEAGEFNRMQAMADYEAHDSVEPKSENVTKAEPVKDRIDAILEERGKAYGSVEDNFQRVAHLWNGYLEALKYHELLPEDVARMMQLFKMARRLVLDKPTKDSFDDGHGYLKCEEMLCQ
jgi:hypothetical protein